MTTSTRGPEKARVNEKDNMLKYQISDDKEENDLLDFVMGSEDDTKPGKNKGLKDGEMISVE